MNEPTEATIEKTLDEVDGRTTIGKLQARVKELEDNQKKIQEMLGDHHRRIDECCIQR